MEGDQDGTDCEASAHGTQASAGNKRYRTTGCMSTQTSMPGTQTVLSGIKKISLGTQNSPASSCAIEDPENVKQLEVIGKTLVPLPQSDREPLQAFPPSASSVLLSDPRALSTASTLSRGQIDTSSNTSAIKSYTAKAAYPPSFLEAKKALFPLFEGAAELGHIPNQDKYVASLVDPLIATNESTKIRTPRNDAATIAGYGKKIWDSLVDREEKYALQVFDRLLPDFRVGVQPDLNAQDQFTQKTFLANQLDPTESGQVNTDLCAMALDSENPDYQRFSSKETHFNSVELPRDGRRLDTRIVPSAETHLREILSNLLHRNLLSEYKHDAIQLTCIGECADPWRQEAADLIQRTCREFAFHVVTQDIAIRLLDACLFAHVRAKHQQVDESLVAESLVAESSRRYRDARAKRAKEIPEKKQEINCNQNSNDGAAESCDQLQVSRENESNKVCHIQDVPATKAVPFYAPKALALLQSIPIFSREDLLLLAVGCLWIASKVEEINCLSLRGASGALLKYLNYTATSKGVHHPTKPTFLHNVISQWYQQDPTPVLSEGMLRDSPNSSDRPIRTNARHSDRSASKDRNRASLKEHTHASDPTLHASNGPFSLDFHNDYFVSISSSRSKDLTASATSKDNHATTKSLENSCTWDFIAVDKCESTPFSCRHCFPRALGDASKLADKKKTARNVKGVVNPKALEKPTSSRWSSVSELSRSTVSEWILELEPAILEANRWMLHPPTPHNFLGVLFIASGMTENNLCSTLTKDGGPRWKGEVSHLARYLLELGSIHPYTSGHYRPSALAAAALFLSRLSTISQSEEMQKSALRAPDAVKNIIELAWGAGLQTLTNYSPYDPVLQIHCYQLLLCLQLHGEGQVHRVSDLNYHQFIQFIGGRSPNSVFSDLLEKSIRMQEVLYERPVHSPAFDRFRQVSFLSVGEKYNHIGLLHCIRYLLSRSSIHA